MGVFGKLPDLFDRNFAIGFLLPAAILAGGLYGTLHAFGRRPDWLAYGDPQTFLDAALIAVGVWLLAIALLAVNRPLVRCMEGYSFRECWPLRWLGRRWRARFRARVVPPARRQRETDAARAAGTAEPALPADHATALRMAVEGFPDREEDVLPTRFGNQYRSIEVYSRVVYGLDAIPAWGRLEALIPAAFQARLAEAKAQVDFALNLVLAGLLTLLLYGGMALSERGLPAPWVPATAIAVLAFGYLTAFNALGQYGLYVRSAFDLYRRDLAVQLDLELPRSPAAEREMWTEVSRMMIYRSPAAWDRLTRYRRRGGTPL